MYPTNHYMDPYSSYYRHHAPHPYYPPPGWEAGRQQMPEVDSSCRPPYGPWTYSGSMNHSGVPESHSCCNHTYPPGYYSFRPPFPQELPPPPPVYYHGPFPPHHPNPYSPSSYFGPMPSYPVDQTPYNGYDKFKSHCCGCPNHVCHGGEKSNVKIEEHMPEVKPESNHKGADNSSIIRNPNYQYPVMWLQSGDMKDKGDRRSFEIPPQLFSKWFPQTGERTEDVKPSNDDQKAKQLQWPIVWMPPGYDGTKQQGRKELKEIEQSPKNTQEDPPSPKIKKTQEDPPSPKIKIIPLSSWFGNDQKPAARDGSGEQNGRSSATKEPAGIPVVPEKPNSGNEPAISVVPEKQDVEKKVRTCRTIPVMAQKESDEKKPYLDGNKEEKKAIMVEKEGKTNKSNNVESSKSKPSKLPPVCLRVDPLPKKKSGNATSRSSNPATRKLCQKDKVVKEAQGKNQETKLSEHQKEGNVLVKEESSDEIGKVTGSRNVTVLDASMKHTQEEQSSTSMTDQKVQPSISAEARENVSVNSLQECDKNRKEHELKIQGEASNLAPEIKLSEPDAAVRIQSAYRGYHGRRWQPLEKLRKIKNVHRQMQDVEKQLQALEASSKQPTEKEHIAINETIMNLLLNLDTIQGLHPVVREARKSVARQLVCLQEKLDSLCNKPSAEPNNHAKSEEVSLTGVDEEKLPAREPMHDDVSLEVSLKLSQEGDSTEQKKHQMEESSTANEEARDKGEAAAPTEFQGVSPMDVMCDAASSGLITDKKHQMEETGILREECTEDEKTARKGEGSSDLYMEGSVLKQGTPSADQNSNAEESDQGVSLTTTEDGTTAISTASLGSEVAVDDVTVRQKEVRCRNPFPLAALRRNSMLPLLKISAKNQVLHSFIWRIHLSSEVADPHGNDPALADDSITINPGEKQEESVDVDMQKEVADAPLDSGKEPNGTPTAPVGDTGVTGANAESSTQEEIALVGPEATKQCEVSHEDDSAALVDQQNELRVEDPAGGSAVVETEAVPLEVEGKTTMENAMNDAIGEEPEAVPLESKAMTKENTQNDGIGEEPESVPLEIEDKTMEDTLNDAGSVPSNTSAEPALPESTGDGSPCEHDGGAVCGDYPDSMVSPESQGDLQEEQDDDGGKVSTFEAIEGDATIPAEIQACATGANSAVPVPIPEEEMPKEGAEGVPALEEAATTISATQDGLKGATNDDKSKGLADENEKLKEMLHKLLMSGNDQMGVIAELSDKVKALERKLARKRMPKVRVQHGPARNATAANNVH